VDSYNRSKTISMTQWLRCEKSFFLRSFQVGVQSHCFVSRLLLFLCAKHLALGSAELYGEIPVHCSVDTTDHAGKVAFRRAGVGSSWVQTATKIQTAAWNDWAFEDASSSEIPSSSVSDAHLDGVIASVAARPMLTEARSSFAASTQPPPATSATSARKLHQPSQEERKPMNLVSKADSAWIENLPMAPYLFENRMGSPAENASIKQPLSRSMQGRLAFLKEATRSGDSISSLDTASGLLPQRAAVPFFQQTHRHAAAISLVLAVSLLLLSILPLYLFLLIRSERHDCSHRPSTPASTHAQHPASPLACIYLNLRRQHAEPTSPLSSQGPTTLGTEADCLGERPGQQTRSPLSYRHSDQGPALLFGMLEADDFESEEYNSICQQGSPRSWQSAPMLGLRMKPVFTETRGPEGPLCPEYGVPSGQQCELAVPINALAQSRGPMCISDPDGHTVVVAHIWNASAESDGTCGHISSKQVVLQKPSGMILARCQMLSPEQFRLSDGAGEFHATLVAGMDGSQYNLVTKHGYAMCYRGNFDEYMLDIADSDGHLLAVSEKCTAARKPETRQGYFSIVLAPGSDLGLVLCGMLCAFVLHGHSCAVSGDGASCRPERDAELPHKSES